MRGFLMIRRIRFIPEHQAVGIIPNANDVMISITDGHVAELATEWNMDQLLRLCFHDYDGTESWIGEAQYVTFNESMATQIREFISTIHNSKVSHSLFVHCHAGISRSTAVSKYASDICGVPIPPHPNYNRKVYSVLSGTYQQWVDKFNNTIDEDQ
jgi:predicted protein tyrosine phosphatase